MLVNQRLGEGTEVREESGRSRGGVCVGVGVGEGFEFLDDGSGGGGWGGWKLRMWLWLCAALNSTVWVRELYVWNVAGVDAAWVVKSEGQVGGWDGRFVRSVF